MGRRCDSASSTAHEVLVLKNSFLPGADRLVLDQHPVCTAVISVHELMVVRSTWPLTEIIRPRESFSCPAIHHVYFKVDCDFEKTLVPILVQTQNCDTHLELPQLLGVRHKQIFQGIRCHHRG